MRNRPDRANAISEGFSPPARLSPQPAGRRLEIDALIYVILIVFTYCDKPAFDRSASREFRAAQSDEDAIRSGMRAVTTRFFRHRSDAERRDGTPVERQPRR